VITYGAALAALEMPDRAGRLDDVVLGFDDLAGYLAGDAFIGATIGRYPNRIAGGRFTLDGRTHRLAVNDRGHTLHGGPRGFHTALWEAEPLAADDGAGVRLRYVSADGEEGFPGRLEAEVRYRLADDDTLTLDYLARADAPTPVGLTHHSYFNLGGAGKGDVLAHQLAIAALHFTPVDTTLIPTGERRPVEGTPFDFRQPAAIGSRIGQEDEQLRRGGGYDHNFVLDRSDAGLVHAARVTEPGSGRVLDVWTTEPGLQLYSGNFLDVRRGKDGRAYGRHAGFCLEPQPFPDSPNQPDFPDSILRPGHEYRSRTVFRFDVDGA
jgi:aldose 1-epimerase